MLLTTDVGDQIAVKSGFSSGYGGVGPVCFSVTLQLLDSHGVEIDEWVTDEAFIERLDQSGLTVADVEAVTSGRVVRPSRWPQYILDHHAEQGRNGALWSQFPPVMPFSIIDCRIVDLALTFWKDCDKSLSLGYRRLEGLVRERAGISESGTKLFSRAFIGKEAILTWPLSDEGEKMGRANLFTGTYMAYRNPRAHQEAPESELLAEFLLFNQLFLLEREAIRAP